MFDEYFKQELKEGEEIVTIVRKHWASFLPVIIKTFIILIIPFFLLAFLFSRWYGVIIFFVWVSVGFAYGLYQWICWYFDTFVITNLRIINIDQKRIFARSVSEAYLASVQDVTYEVAGFLPSAFNYGTVSVQTAGAKPTLQISSVENPKKLQELIMDLHRKAKTSLSAKELVEFLTETKKEFINPKEVERKKE